MLNRFSQIAKPCFFVSLLAAGFAATATGSPLYFSGTNNQGWDNGTTHDWGNFSGGPYNSSPWVGGDDAHFQGTAGAVTVSGSIASVNSLNFDTSGYTLSSGTINLTGNGGGGLPGGGTQINVASGGNATINSTINGSVGITKSGSGLLTLGGNIAYTGTTLISAGTLQVGNGGSGESLASLVITNNAALAFNLSDNLTYGGAISGSGSLTKDGSGTLTVTGSNNSSGYTAINAGTLQIAGGHLSTGAEDVSLGGTASVLQSGGTHSLSGALFLARLGGNGSYALSGSGMLSALGGEVLGGAGFGSFTQSGGTNSAAGIDLGLNPGVNGSYNLGGSGLLSATLYEHVGYSGSGSFTQSGGTNSISGNLTLAVNSLSVGTYNLNGGLLVLSGAGLTQGSGSAAFNFGGGTLGASAPWSSSINLNVTGFGGNSTVDTTGGDISLSGNLSGIGGLTKIGAGTLTLSGSNAFSGVLTVDGGTLNMPGGYLSPLDQYVGSSGSGSDHAVGRHQHGVGSVPGIEQRQQWKL